MLSKIIYRIFWNPDSRWTTYHWSVSMKHAGCISSSSYTFLSDALSHPLWIKEQYPDNTEIVFPTQESKERARKYYGDVLEDMINENEGKYIGC